MAYEEFSLICINSLDTYAQLGDWGGAFWNPISIQANW